MTLATAFNKPDQDRALIKAVEDNDITGIIKACENGANPNVRDPATGRNLLFRLIDQASTEDGKKHEGSLWAYFFALIQRGADADLADKNGMTPLHYGFDKGNVMLLAAMLMQPGLPVNAPDPRTGDTPLHRALPMLLEAKADLDTTPFELLIALAADPAIPNNAGVSALELAKASSAEKADYAVQRMLNTPAMKQRRLLALAKEKPFRLK
ncbi:MAG: hypothetical protein ACAH83_17970 [Alphaproteobacteria bacterium]